MSRLEQLVPCHGSADRRWSCGDAPARGEKRGETARTSPLQRLAVWGVTAAVGSALAFCVSPATAAPCAKHQGAAKVACVKQAKRDAMPYPPDPSWREASRRVSAYDLATAERVSGCEEPGSEHGTGKGASPWARRWSLSGGNYVSGFGMAYSTYGIGARITGYPYPPQASPAQQLLVAVAGAHSFGWSGWGCF